MRTAQPTGPLIPGYTEVGFLGAGGFADVFRYRHATGMTYAVKVWRPEFAGEARRQLQTEAQALGRLAEFGAHPNIVAPNPPADAGGRPYLMMELCPGGSLAGKGPMPVADVLRIGILMCGALETAHLHDVFHCDVKPGNILLTRDATPKLSDFGIAELATAPGGEVTMITPHYSAPEVDEYGDASPLADVYALAATLFELLTGRPPFKVDGGDNGTAAIQRRKSRNEVQPIARGDVAADLTRLLRLVLRADVGERARMLGTSDQTGPAAAFGAELRTIAAARNDEQTPMVVFAPTDTPQERLDATQRREQAAAPGPIFVEPGAPEQRHASVVSVPGSPLPATEMRPENGGQDVAAPPMPVRARTRAGGLRTAGIVMGVLVLVGAVVGLIVGLGTDSSPDASSGDSTPTTAPTDDVNLHLTTVPTPVVTAHRLATGKVRFTWTYAPVSKGDHYYVTRTDATVVTAVPVDVSNWTADVSSRQNPCVDVIVVNSDGLSSSPGRACAPPVSN